MGVPKSREAAIDSCRARAHVNEFCALWSVNPFWYKKLFQVSNFGSQLTKGLGLTLADNVQALCKARHITIHSFILPLATTLHKELAFIHVSQKVLPCVIPIEQSANPKKVRDSAQFLEK